MVTYNLVTYNLVTLSFITIREKKNPQLFFGKTTQILTKNFTVSYRSSIQLWGLYTFYRSARSSVIFWLTWKDMNSTRWKTMSPTIEAVMKRPRTRCLRSSSYVKTTVGWTIRPTCRWSALCWISFYTCRILYSWRFWKYILSFIGIF